MNELLLDLMGIERRFIMHEMEERVVVYMQACSMKSRIVLSPESRVLAAEQDCS